MLIVPALALARIATAWGWTAPLVLAAVTSVVAFAMYFADKRRAERGGWRVSEFALHVIAASGGWPGAFAAQRALRHKTAKLGFQAVFWMTVLVHEILALDYLLDWPLVSALAG